MDILEEVASHRDETTEAQGYLCADDLEKHILELEAQRNKLSYEVFDLEGEIEDLEDEVLALKDKIKMNE